MKPEAGTRAARARTGHADLGRTPPQETPVPGGGEIGEGEIGTADEERRVLPGPRDRCAVRHAVDAAEDRVQEARPPPVRDSPRAQPEAEELRRRDVPALAPRDLGDSGVGSFPARSATGLGRRTDRPTTVSLTSAIGGGRERRTDRPSAFSFFGGRGEPGHAHDARAGRARRRSTRVFPDRVVAELAQERPASRPRRSGGVTPRAHAGARGAGRYACGSAAPGRRSPGGRSEDSARRGRPSSPCARGRGAAARARAGACAG